MLKYQKIGVSENVDIAKGKYKLPDITDPEGIAWLEKGDKEQLHVTYGGGAHCAINDNFVLSLDYGWADLQRPRYVIKTPPNRP